MIILYAMSISLWPILDKEKLGTLAIMTVYLELKVLINYVNSVSYKVNFELKKNSNLF